MYSIKFRCPNPKCRLTLHIPIKSQGRRVRCGACGHSFLVPPSGIAIGHKGKTRKSRKAA